MPEPDDLPLLESAARDAGKLALQYYGGDYKRWNKDGGSPVTEADLAVDRFLHQTLLAARPDYGWLSEESLDDPSRLNTGARTKTRTQYLTAEHNKVRGSSFLNRVQFGFTRSRLDGVDYLSFGMMDLAQSLGHPGNPGHPDVQRAVKDASERVRKAGKRIREDFMNFAWVHEVLLAGAKQLLDGAGSKK